MSWFSLGVILFSAVYFAAAWYMIASPRFPDFYLPTYLALWLLMLSALIDMMLPMLPPEVWMEWFFYSSTLENVALFIWGAGMYIHKTDRKKPLSGSSHACKAEQ